MANICSDAIAVYGNLDKLEKLAGIYRTLAAGKAGWGCVPADRFYRELLAGETFADNVVGEFTSAEIIAKGNPLYNPEIGEWLLITGTSKWGPLGADFKANLAKAMPELDCEWSAEESGCDLFVNTDAEGVFLKERYYVDCNIGKACSLDAEPYAKTEEEALEIINGACFRAGWTGRFASIEEATEFFDDEDNNPFPDCDFFLSVHEYSTEY